MYSLEIRKVLVGDLPKLAHIHLETWKSCYKGIIVQETLDNLQFQNSLRNMERTYNDSEVFFYLASIHDISVGFIIFSLKSRHENYEEYAEIPAIYILPEYHNAGIGKNLIKTAFQVYRELNVTKVMLCALKHNRDKDFYQKCGAVVTKEEEIMIGGNPYLIEIWVWENLSI